MTENPEISREGYPARPDLEEAEITAYVEEHYPGWETELLSAIESAQAQGMDSGTIARPMYTSPTATEKKGMSEIKNRLKDKVKELYPGKKIFSHFPPEHEGKLARDLDPPALTYDAISFRDLVPEDTMPLDQIDMSKFDVRIGLVE